MASPKRRANPSLIEQVYSQGWEFEFHQAIRLLEAFYNTTFGDGNHPFQDPVVIQSRLTLAAPASEVFQLVPSKDLDHPPTLIINFLGLVGIQGPLPTPFTEMVMERLRTKDTGLRDFLDIFNHRLASLWHRTRKKVVLGMGQVLPQQTAAGKVFLNLMGLDTSLLQHQLTIADQSLIQYSPLFWQRPRSASALQKILSTYFNRSIHLCPLEGYWQQAHRKDLTRLGNQQGRFHRLGQEVILGSRTWDQQARLGITFVCTNWQDYWEMIMKGRLYHGLKDLAYLYCGMQTRLFLKLHLKASHIPPARLGQQVKLGQSSWLGKATKDAVHIIALPRP